MQVEVGQIVNTHGIKGEVKVKSNSDFTDTRFQPGEVLTVNHQNHEEQLTVLSYRVHKGFHMLKFEGINNINDVEQYKGDYLYQERDHEDIELAEMNITTLTSLEVLYLIMTINPSAELSIFLKQVQNDVWVVKGEKEYLIPI